MPKAIMILVTVLLAPAVYGGCQVDSPELGDIGPESLLVCKMLEHQHPYSGSIKVLGREPYSRNRVRVFIEVDNRQASLLYDLVRANWHLVDFRLTSDTDPAKDLDY